MKAIVLGRTWPMAERDRLAEMATAASEVLASSDQLLARTMMLKLASLIEVQSDGVTITLNTTGLMAALGCDMEFHEFFNAGKPQLHIPVTLRRRGVETKMVVTRDGIPEAGPDETLIRAIARARRWMNDLLNGTHGTIVDLAAAYSTNANYVAKHLPLACLSPMIIQSIIDGRQPVELSAWDLMNRIEMPLDWTDQARRLGMC